MANFLQAPHRHARQFKSHGSHAMCGLRSRRLRFVAKKKEHLMFRNIAPGAVGIKLGMADAVALAGKVGWEGMDLPVVEAQQLAAEQGTDAVAALFAEAGVRPGGWGLPFNWR